MVKAGGKIADASAPRTRTAQGDNILYTDIISCKLAQDVSEEHLLKVAGEVLEHLMG